MIYYSLIGLANVQTRIEHHRYLNGMERLKEKIQFDFKTLEFWNLEFQCRSLIQLIGHTATLI